MVHLGDAIEKLISALLLQAPDSSAAGVLIGTVLPRVALSPVLQGILHPWLLLTSKCQCPSVLTQSIPSNST